MHVRGRRYVVVNHEAQLISIEGLVRREDIGIDNKVASTALAEAQITYDGLGVLDDKQRPGLLARVLDWAYPF
jgi:flagellar L-ring protein precursor FlgH